MTSWGSVYHVLLKAFPAERYFYGHKLSYFEKEEQLVTGYFENRFPDLFSNCRQSSLPVWENHMPLARTAMYVKGVQIYLASTADDREVWQSTLRHITLGGSAVVGSLGQYIVDYKFHKSKQLLLAGFIQEVQRNFGSSTQYEVSD